jgi:hypothetical protein
MSSFNVNALVVSPLSGNTQLVDAKTGNLTPYGQVVFNRIIQAINSALNILGQFNGVIGTAATIEGHPGTVAHIAQNLTGTGQLNSLTNVVADRNLDNIADTATYAKTTVNGALGAATAYSSLVASSPTTNNALLWNGSDWVPSDVPVGAVSGLVPAVNAPLVINKWLQTYNATTGVFGYAQVNFNNVAGNLTTAQLPAAGESVTVPIGPLTVGGAAGSATYTNGVLTAHVDPT